MVVGSETIVECVEDGQLTFVVILTVVVVGCEALCSIDVAVMVADSGRLVEGCTELVAVMIGAGVVLVEAGTTSDGVGLAVELLLVPACVVGDEDMAATSVP